MTDEYSQYIGKIWFELNPRLRRCLGKCFLNRAFVELQPTEDMEQLFDTISHEIAHYIAFMEYKDHGHGSWWKYVHKRLGGNSQRVAVGVPYVRNKVKRVVLERDGKEYKVTQQFFKKNNFVLLKTGYSVKQVIVLDRNVPLTSSTSA